MAIDNNLFPPVIETFMPAFVRTGDCKVYFALSRFTRQQDIKNIQLTLVNQQTNRSELNVTNYPTGIKLCQIQTDPQRVGEDKYYVTISPEEVAGGSFGQNRFYKVQLRVTGVAAADPPPNNKIHSWLNANKSFFSEWSTVCLIKGIDAPVLRIRGFDDFPASEGTVFTSQLTQIVGRMEYPATNSKEKEVLKSFRVRLFKKSDEEKALYDSGEVLTNSFAPNEFNHTVKQYLKDGVKHVLTVDFETRNGFKGSQSYSFTVVQHGIDKLDATVEVEKDIEEGRVKVTVKGKTSESFLGNVTIRRASSKTNFTIWEDVFTAAIEDGSALNFEWYDTTVESGVFYRYGAQRRSSKGDRGVVTLSDQKVILELEDMFLTRADSQLKIKLDQSVQNFRRNVTDIMDVSLGGKYPLFRRMGNASFHSFSIGGTISSYADESNVFASPEEFYGAQTGDYREYHEEENTQLWRDQIYEKNFRDKVMDFLYDNKVCLFRTQAEGSLIVKITDVTFSPIQSLGRLLYTFSATATEVAEATFDNIAGLGLIEQGGYKSQISRKYQKISQLDGEFGANEDLVAIISDRFNRKSSERVRTSTSGLTWVRIEFESEPYLIKTTPQGLEPLGEGESPANALTGYLVKINGQTMLVSGKTRRLELRDKDVLVTSMSLPKKARVLIDFLCEINETEAEKKLATRYSYIKKVSQLWGAFDYDAPLVKEIYVKHLQNYTTHYQRIVAITRVNIESDQGTVVIVQDSKDKGAFRHLVGPTLRLELGDEDITINELSFRGVHLEPKRFPNRLETYDYEFVNVGEKIENTFAEVRNPVKNGVYRVATEVIGERRFYVGAGDKIDLLENEAILPPHIKSLIANDETRVIYYKDSWYLITPENDVICPVNGLVDYQFEMVRGEY